MKKVSRLRVDKTMLLMMLTSVVGLAGCVHQPVASPIVPRSDADIAIASLPKDSLQKCTGLDANGNPTNSVGNLLQDYETVAAVAAICASRHNPLVDYLTTIKEKQK